MKRCLLPFFTLLSFFAAGQNFDIDLLKSVNEKETSFKNDFTNIVSKSVTPVNIAAPVTLLVFGLAKHDTKLQKEAACFAGSYLISAVITSATKHIVHRQRPYNAYSFITKRDVGGGYSFPSGHTSAAFSAATSLSIMYPKWYVIVPSYLWASSVGYARMYQGVHYPSDVIAGAIVGAGSAWAAYKIRKWMDKKAAAKKAATPAL